MIHEEERSRILEDNILVKEDLDETDDGIVINRSEPDNEVLNEEEMFKLLDEEDDIVSPSYETDQNREISEAKPLVTQVTQNSVNSPEFPTANPEITEITIPIVYVFAVIIVGVLAAVFFMNH